MRPYDLLASVSGFIDPVILAKAKAEWFASRRAFLLDVMANYTENPEGYSIPKNFALTVYCSNGDPVVIRDIRSLQTVLNQLVAPVEEGEVITVTPLAKSSNSDAVGVTTTPELIASTIGDIVSTLEISELAYMSVTSDDPASSFSSKVAALMSDSLSRVKASLGNVISALSAGDVKTRVTSLDAVLGILQYQGAQDDDATADSALSSGSTDIGAYTGINPVLASVSGIDFSSAGDAIASVAQCAVAVAKSCLSTLWSGAKSLWDKAKTWFNTKVAQPLNNPADARCEAGTFGYAKTVARGLIRPSRRFTKPLSKGEARTISIGGVAFTSIGTDDPKVQVAECFVKPINPGTAYGLIERNLGFNDAGHTVGALVKTLDALSHADLSLSSKAGDKDYCLGLLMSQFLASTVANLLTWIRLIMVENQSGRSVMDDWPELSEDVTLSKAYDNSSVSAITNYMLSQGCITPLIQMGLVYAGFSSNTAFSMPCGTSDRAIVPNEVSNADLVNILSRRGIVFPGPNSIASSSYGSSVSPSFPEDIGVEVVTIYGSNSSSEYWVYSTLDKPHLSYIDEYTGQDNYEAARAGALDWRCMAFVMETIDMLNDRYRYDFSPSGMNYQPVLAYSQGTLPEEPNTYIASDQELADDASGVIGAITLAAVAAVVSIKAAPAVVKFIKSARLSSLNMNAAMSRYTKAVSSGNSDEARSAVKAYKKARRAGSLLRTATGGVAVLADGGLGSLASGIQDTEMSVIATVDEVSKDMVEDIKELFIKFIGHTS